MKDLNMVNLTGNLTRDVEMRYTPSGESVATFGIAVNRSFKNSAGEYEADFIDCVTWKKLAELCSQYLAKGSKVLVSGRLQTRNYETPEGQRRKVWEVVAEDIKFLSKKQED
jgi:single-strand DNA-binding protein